MKTLLYFGADWCQTSQELEPVVADAVLESAVKFLKYDVEEAPQVAEQYQINVIPCIIILDDEVQVKKLIGKKTKEEILKALHEESNSL